MATITDHGQFPVVSAVGVDAPRSLVGWTTALIGRWSILIRAAVTINVRMSALPPIADIKADEKFCRSIPGVSSFDFDQRTGNSAEFEPALGAMLSRRPCCMAPISARRTKIFLTH
jgi:hypothetical protein